MATLSVITGVEGFVGNALCAYLRDQGRPLIGAVRAMRSGMPRDLQPVGDLTQASDATLDELVDGADTLVHLAGRAHVMHERASNPEAEYARANTELTRRLAKAAGRTGVRRFILASTVKVNGDSTRANQPFTPTDEPNPSDAYGRSKLAAEQALVDALNDTATIPIILRFPLVYGRSAKGNFKKLVDAVVAERRLPLASVRNRRSLLYVGNLVEAISMLIDAPLPPRGVHFVADAESVSTPDLVRAIAVAWKVKPRLVAIPVPLLQLAGSLSGRRAEITRLTDSLEVDATSLRHAIGWKPRFSLDAALARTASTHRNAPPY
ncbi:MAG TPA: NAD-dependent epimerase/dehydratase family protein [Casimicrobiaceae bacterium]|nr:NAD-dependent epimerase/dehydratase family protein [Casimicrobiaceae bacterium]